MITTLEARIGFSSVRPSRPRFTNPAAPAGSQENANCAVTP